MFQVNQEDFERYVGEAVQALPRIYVDHLDNVAFIIENQPTAQQRQELALRHDQTLFGLYQGVPLTKRLGQTKILPDKITIFQTPLQRASNNLEQLRSNIGRTVWHEVAHYFGLGHDRIHELEHKELKDFLSRHGFGSKS